MIKTAPEAAIVAARPIATAMVPELSNWYEQRRTKVGKVDSNIMCAGLYITEFLATSWPLKDSVYLSDSQVRGASGRKAQAILADHGETRRFTAEGGRTSRNTVTHAKSLADVVNNSGKLHGVDSLTTPERGALAWLLQDWFVERVRDDYFGRQKISAQINPNWTVRATVATLLGAGRLRGGNTAGAVAQHLVGAKLQIRFPDMRINVESYTTADQQTGRAGDYQVGDTAFHVTMSPALELFTGRCQHNIDHGFRPRVLVPASEVTRAIHYAEAAGIYPTVAVQSIEDFIGTNIEEVADFTSQDIRIQLRKLLELYNERIDRAEPDKSLKIEVPANL